jgi:hypothetical protein
MTPTDQPALQESVLQRRLLLLAALFAIVWAVARACLQSITMDEAQTYLFFVAPPQIWYPFPNNHVLNTLLIWMTTHVFGTSAITVRMPALLGGALYIVTCYFLCRKITNRFSLQFPLFICLTFNPLIFDFMVAARGYSLADAFLLAGIAIPVWYTVNAGRSLQQSCLLASVALGLSFSANFSFAFVDFAAWLAVMIWASTVTDHRDLKSIARVIGLCTLPGLCVALLICGYPLAHWKRSELWWGAHSLGEMTRSLVDSSLYQPDPKYLAAGVYEALNRLKPLLLPLLGILCLCRLAAVGLDGSWLRYLRAAWQGRLAAALGGIAALSVLMHWLAFHFDNLPLPMGRTGIYLVPLCTLVAGIIAAAPARSVISRWLGRGIITAFFCVAFYFLLCLRLTYFKEYEWNADVKDVYSVLARLNHSYGVTDVGITNPLYLDSLNFYRVLSKRETFPAFAGTLPDLPVTKPVYVLHGGHEGPFIEKGRLVIVYRGKSTEVVVAVPPGGPIPPTMIDEARP